MSSRKISASSCNPSTLSISWSLAHLAVFWDRLGILFTRSPGSDLAIDPMVEYPAWSRSLARPAFTPGRSRSGSSSGLQQCASRFVKGSNSSWYAQNSSISIQKWRTEEEKLAAEDIRFWTSPLDILNFSATSWIGDVFQRSRRARDK